MRYELRDYQKHASDAAVRFFLDGNKNHNAIIVCPTGAGKSIIVADIAFRLNTDVLVFCPTKEITQQNYAKMKSYGIPCGMYSASVGRKDIERVTFATIGSVKNNTEMFAHFQYILVDECHLCNPNHGMYKDFFKKVPRKVLGLTATPYRLETDVKMDWKTRTFQSAKSYLKMLTAYKRPIFSEIIYNIDAETLSECGFLAEVEYYKQPPKGWNTANLFKNTSGSDYTDSSVRSMYNRTGFEYHLVNIVCRLQNPKSGVKRNGILVFTRFVKEAEMLANNIEGCAFISGDMTKANRERILKDFEDGNIQVLANAGVLICGYDRPDLDTVVLAAPTLSLARYYQEIGRAIRPSEKKESAWVIDLCGNIDRFGKVEDLKLLQAGNGVWDIYSNGRQLTNVYM